MRPWAWAPAETPRDQYGGELFGVRWAMETVLIVLLVLFVLGGGGWGYSRWRR